MRMPLIHLVLLGLLVTACAESVHQQERRGLEQTGATAGPQSSWLPLDHGPESFERYDSVASTPFPPSQGQSVALSGIVLKAKRLQGMTELEILHLPTGVDGQPVTDRRLSQGRFLARQSTFLDPAVFAAKPFVTVRGIVEGVVERPLEPGADNYSYPIVTIQDLTVWPDELLRSRSDPPPPSGATSTITPAATAYPFDFWGAFFQGIGQALFAPNRHRHDSWSYSSSPSSSSSSSPPPSPPPPDQIPPQFRKGK